MMIDFREFSSQSLATLVRDARWTYANRAAMRAELKRRERAAWDAPDAMRVWDDTTVPFRYSDMPEWQWNAGTVA